MFYVTKGSIPLFGSMILSLMAMVVLVVIYFYVDRKKVLLLFILIEGVWAAYSTCFLLMVNADTAYQVFLYARCLYTFLLFVVTSIVYAVDHIVDYDGQWTGLVSFFISLSLATMIWVSDGPILSSEVVYTFYYTPKKGPFLSLLLVYALGTGCVLIYRMYSFRKRATKDMYRVARPMTWGLIFFVLHSSFVGYSSVINPMIKPSNHINVLFMTLMIMWYIYNDINYNILLREQLLEAYMVDGLTKLYSRNHILNLVDEKILSMYSRNHYVALIDLDGFKSINDLYGHMKGDEVLCGFGELCLRLGNQNIESGRLGGDEFMIIFSQMNKKLIGQWLEKLSDLYEAYLIEHGIRIGNQITGISVGYLQLIEGYTLKELLIDVDKPMYEAKLSGRNNIVFYG